MENQPVNPAMPGQAPVQPQQMVAETPMPPKKSKKGLIIGIIIAAVVVIAAVITGAIFLFRGVMDSGSAEAVAFVDDISNERFDEAYARFSPQLKDIQDFDAFVAQIGTLNLDSSCAYKPQSTEIGASSTGNTTKETAGRIECYNQTFSGEFKFVEIDTMFKLYMYNIQPMDSDASLDNYSTPTDMDTLRSMMLSRSALNCTVTDPTGITVLIQANSGWSKLFIQNGDESVLVIQGEGMYTWSDEGAYKLAYDPEYVDGIGSELDEYGDIIDYTGYTFSCDNPGSANFSLPAGIEFADLTDLDYIED